VPFLEIRGKPFAEPPFNRFFEFIAPNADRYRILKSLLEELGIDSLVFTVAGNRHFFIFPRGAGARPGSQAAGAFPFSGKNPVILTAHYDRAPGSPGANDNSAAVFLLIKAAGLLRAGGAGNWITILTDKEELGPGEGICSQGSYTLAETLRRNGLEKGRIFIFDSCGTGDTLIVSSTADYLFDSYLFAGYLFNRKSGKGTLKARQLTRELRNTALETARRLNMDKVLLLPTPFSEDAGFLKAGLPAITITALPSREASSFVSLLRKRPDFANALMIRENRKTEDEPLIPETWRRLNGPKDLPSRLTPEHYGRILRFAQRLCWQ
jgi:hypothetical protein